MLYKIPSQIKEVLLRFKFQEEKEEESSENKPFTTSPHYIGNKGGNPDE